MSSPTPEDSYNRVAPGLASGEFVRSEFIPSTQTLVGLTNQKLRFFRNDDSSVDAIVYEIEGEVYPPNPKFEFEARVAEPVFAPLHIDDESLKEWRLTSFVGNTKKARTLVESASFQWSSGKSFADLQALNLMFLQGLIPATPYHLGPLDPETNLVLSAVNLMNRLDMITVNSQPYEVFPSYQDRRNTVHQYAFVNFYFPRYKSLALDELIRANVDTAQVLKYDFKSGRETRVASPKELVEGVVPLWLDYRGNTLVKKTGAQSETHYPDLGPLELGDNFEELVLNDLVVYDVNDTRSSNTIFEDLAGLAKELI